MRWPRILRTRRWQRKVWRWPTATPPTVAPRDPPTFTDDEAKPKPPPS